MLSVAETHSLGFRNYSIISTHSTLLAGEDLQSCSKGFFPNDLCKSKISQLDREVSICEKDVFRLYISMDDVALVL